MDTTERMDTVNRILRVILLFKHAGTYSKEDWTAITRMLRDDLNAYLFAEKYGTSAAAASRILKSAEDPSRRRN